MLEKRPAHYERETMDYYTHRQASALRRNIQRLSQETTFETKRVLCFMENRGFNQVQAVFELKDFYAFLNLRREPASGLVQLRLGTLYGSTCFAFGLRTPN